MDDLPMFSKVVSSVNENVVHVYKEFLSVGPLSSSTSVLVF